MKEKEKIRVILLTILVTTVFWGFALFASVGYYKQKGYRVTTGNQPVDPGRGSGLWEYLGQEHYVAKASMSQDGKQITVNLRRTDRGFKNWNTYYSYKKEDPYYAEVLRRIGRLEPGETKELSAQVNVESPPVVPVATP